MKTDELITETMCCLFWLAAIVSLFTGSGNFFELAAIASLLGIEAGVRGYR